MTDKAEIKKLTDLMERLRSPGGCPWDREQTLRTLTPFIIEEAYEVVSAIDSGSAEEMKEELGDLLFQVVFCSRIAEEEGLFDLAGVIDGCVEKMVRRHPHVFADATAETSEEVLRNWAEIKDGEKKEKRTTGEKLAGVPEVLPALLRAHKISQKAAKVGFDWADVREVLTKVDEELGEFREAVERKDAEAMEEELGDLLFTVVNAARFVEVNPEDALRRTIGKFITRFHHVERDILDRGGDLSSASMEEMERLWQEAKETAREAAPEGARKGAREKD